MTRALRIALAVATMCTVALPSRAQEFIAGDDSVITSNGNWGFNKDVRLGYRTGIGRVLYAVTLQPELVGGYRQIFAPTGSPFGDLHMGRIGGGLRGGGSYRMVQFFLYVHGSVADANGNWGPLVDGGTAVDVRFNWWSLGVHYAHSALWLTSGWQNFDEVGLHAEFRAFVF